MLLSKRFVFSDWSDYANDFGTEFSDVMESFSHQEGSDSMYIIPEYCNPEFLKTQTEVENLNPILIFESINYCNAYKLSDNRLYIEFLGEVDADSQIAISKKPMTDQEIIDFLTNHLSIDGWEIPAEIDTENEEQLHEWIKELCEKEEIDYDRYY